MPQPRKIASLGYVLIHGTFSFICNGLNCFVCYSFIDDDISKGIPVPPTEEELLCEKETHAEVANEKSMETKEIEKGVDKLQGADPPQS